MISFESFFQTGTPVETIIDQQNAFNAALRREEESGKPVDIGADVWVGGGTLILAGVHVGWRAIIGGGSVVTRDIPAGVFAAGNPCGVIRDIVE